MITSEQTNEIVPAFIAFQTEVETASNDSTNPHFKSKYADLASVWNACRTYLSKNHLAVIQSPSFFDNRIVITTRIIHKSGQWMEGSLPLKPIKDDPQAAGSTITYGRRYALSSMLGIVADEDDDGSTASKQSKETEENTKLRAEVERLQKEIARLKAEAKPPRIFSAKNLQHVASLEKILDNEKIAADMKIKVMDYMEGKNIDTDLGPYIKRIKAGEVS